MEDPTCPVTPPLSKCPDTPPRAGSSKSSPSRWNNTSECKDESRSSTPNRPTSPENCAICLGPLTNKSFTNSCCHQFCFVCLLEWSKVKAECPLCKVAFDSIIHNVRSQDDYDQYHVVRQPPPLPNISSSVVLHSRSSTVLFEYRRFSQWLAQHGLTNRRPETMPHPLVLDAIPTGPPTRSASRVVPTNGTSAFRRSIYERDLWARLQCDVTGRYRECSPEFYLRNPAMMNRLVPFLNRELNVLLVNGQRSAFVMDKILELLPVHSMSSTAFRREVISLIGPQYASHFCHELRAFASSPYDLIGYDRAVQYHHNGGAGVSIEVEDSESDHGGNSDYDDDDIQIIESGSQSIASRRASSASASASATATSAAGSAESLPEAHHSSVVQVNLSSDSDSDGNGDVEIVGFVKPRHERTPEVITLSSPEHPGLSSSQRRHDEEGSNTSPLSSDELICINLGSSSSAVHRWQDTLNEISSDESSVAFSPNRRQDFKRRKYDAHHLEPVSSESSQSASSSSEDERKTKHSRHKRSKRKHMKHSKSKPYESGAGPSGSEDESQPSSSRGRLRSRTRYYSAQLSSRTSIGDNSLSRSNIDSDECQPSTSRERLSSKIRAERKHCHPRISRRDSMFVRSSSGSNTDHSPPRAALRSAIVPSHSKTNYNSRFSSEDDAEESDHKKLYLKRTNDENHDSWNVDNSDLTIDSLRHHSHRHNQHISSHSSKSPSHHRHRKHQDSESSDSKRKHSRHGKSLSGRSSKSGRKRRERSRTPDSYSTSPKKMLASPCSDNDMPSKSHRKKQKTLASSDSDF